MSTIKEALKQAEVLLSSTESVVLDAELLLASVLGHSREYLYTWPEQELSANQQVKFRQKCQRRREGHPIAYLTGKRSFWTLELSVNSHVLIPRPETELLVELALEILPQENLLIADLGTGSGAIALSLASERPTWQILACDVSDEALSIASSNRDSLEIPNVDFRRGQWCAAFSENNLHGIIANPPYIDEYDPHLSQGDVRFEPALALVSGELGLADIRLIASQSLEKLKAGGWLLLEHGYQQGDAVRSLLTGLGYREVATHRDLSANERVTIGRLE